MAISPRAQRTIDTARIATATVLLWIWRPVRWFIRQPIEMARGVFGAASLIALVLLVGVITGAPIAIVTLLIYWITT